MHKGVAVFVEQRSGEIQGVSLELLGKGKELANKLGEKLTAILLGNNIDHLANELIYHGADEVVVVNNPALDVFVTEPYTKALVNESLDSFKNRISGLSTSYGIDNSSISHIVTNMEWGATLYLSHSKYGVCKDGTCQSIGNNNSYISESNKQDTTTRSVYGVYDMSGGLAEYVVGNNSIGSALDEVRINDNTTWYNGSYLNYNKDYTLRGGIDRGMYSVSDIGMFDVSTRAVLVSK